MKFSTRFLSVFCALCFTLCAEPFARADSPIGGPGPAFENSGGSSGNRTAFTGNTGALNNNQWNNMMNQNPIGQQGATADFGNCNSLILRCAQPKCAGCTSMDLAIPIVTGCVQSNSSCKKYGDELIQTLAAQMVSSANAKANEAQAAAAASAAQAASAQSSAQMEQMQQQMTQMQQQMQEQSAQSAAAVQQALEEQKQLAAQQAEAAVAAATAPDVAIANAAAAGVSADVLAREQIGGQILTKVEDAEVSMKDLKNTMQNVFDYAGCDVNGDNCTGPKRVRAFKDKANKFFDPYENVLDELYDALILAQSLGVDITDIYMMLNGSCNVWGKYMCDTCRPDNENKLPDGCEWDNTTRRGYYQIAYEDYQGNRRVASQQPHCTLLNMLNNQEEVQQNWLYMDAGSSGGIRVACASDAIDNSKLFKNRKKQASIDVETLKRIINQDAPNVVKDPEDAKKWCRVNDEEIIGKLRTMTQRRRLPDSGLCVDINNLDKQFSVPGNNSASGLNYNINASTTTVTPNNSNVDINNLDKQFSVPGNNSASGLNYNINASTTTVTPNNSNRVVFVPQLKAPSFVPQLKAPSFVPQLKAPSLNVPDLSINPGAGNGNKTNMFNTGG